MMRIAGQRGEGEEKKEERAQWRRSSDFGSRFSVYFTSNNVLDILALYCIQSINSSKSFHNIYRKNYCINAHLEYISYMKANFHGLEIIIDKYTAKNMQ